MKIFNWTKRFSRRRFLAGSAATAATVAVTHGAVLAREHVVPAPGELKPEDVRTLIVFTRDLFPHDRLDDSYYARAVKPLQDESAKDGRTRSTLEFGILWLNGSAYTATGKQYAEIDEAKRVEIVKRLRVDQSAPAGFWDKVYNTTIVSLYNQPELWPKFGYEGPSSGKGGYLHRGFNDLDWL
jgi:hypothetical protein